MKEILELRINYQYAHLLFKEDEGINLGDPLFGPPSVKVVKVDTSTPLWEQVKKTCDYVYEKYKKTFYYSWNFKRIYTTKEVAEAKLFKMEVRKCFEPAGEECGTEYDEQSACPICGTGRKQVSPLKLKKGRFLNKRDVARTLSYEIVVSKRFVEVVQKNDIKGMTFGPVYLNNKLSEDCFQLMMEGEHLEVDEQTKFGGDPYDIYPDEGWAEGCPKGDHLGLNILSEAYVKASEALSQYDFLLSRQAYGVKKSLSPNSLFYPQHLLFCSPRLYHVIKDNGLKGFDFEVAHVVK